MEAANKKYLQDGIETGRPYTIFYSQSNANRNVHVPCVTPVLMAATYLEDLSAVKILVDSGANPNKGDRNMFPLEVAIEKANLLLVNLLLMAPGVDLNKTARYVGPAEISTNRSRQTCYTPLLTATAGGDWAIVQRLLVESGIDLNFTSITEETALHCAVKPLYGYQYLHERVKKVHDGRMLCLHFLLNDYRLSDKIVKRVYSLCKSFIFLVEQAIEHDCSVLNYPTDYQPWNEEDKGKTFWSIKPADALERMKQIVAIFLEERNGLTDWDLLGLPEVVSANVGGSDSWDTELFEYLNRYTLEEDINRGTIGEIYHDFHEVDILMYSLDTKLGIACRYGSIDEIETILAQPGVDVNKVSISTKNSPLINACIHEHDSVVKRLLQIEGLDLNLRCGKGLSALDILVGKQKLDLVNVLLADPRLKKTMYRTALKIAVREGRTNIVTAFLPILTSGRGRYYKWLKDVVYCEACSYGRLDIVKLMVEAGCHVNYNRSFSRAAFGRHLDVVRYLMPMVRLVEPLRMRFRKEQIGCMEGIELKRDQKGHIPALEAAIGGGAVNVVAELLKLPIKTFYIENLLNSLKKEKNLTFECHGIAINDVYHIDPAKVLVRNEILVEVVEKGPLSKWRIVGKKPIEEHLLVDICKLLQSKLETNCVHEVFTHIPSDICGVISTLLTYVPSRFPMPSSRTDTANGVP